METASVVISIITSIITAGTLIYKLGFKNDYAREKRYYKKVLKPFMKGLAKNANMNVMEMCKELVKRMDDDVPKYVVFLIKENRVDDLKKVLVCDYFDIYENDDNKMGRIFEIFQKLCVYVLIGISIFLIISASLCVVAGGCLLVLAVVNMLQEATLASDVLLGIGTILLAAILYGAACLTILIVKKLSTDRYTVKEDRIKKIIDKKIEYYNKNQSKLIY